MKGQPVGLHLLLLAPDPAGGLQPPEGEIQGRLDAVDVRPLGVMVMIEMLVMIEVLVMMMVMVMSTCVFITMSLMPWTWSPLVAPPFLRQHVFSTYTDKGPLLMQQALFDYECLLLFWLFPSVS